MGRAEGICQNLRWGSRDLPALPFLWERQQSTAPSHDGVQVNTADMPTLAASLQEGLLSTKSTHMFSSVYTLTTHRQATRLLGATCALLPVTVCGISTVMSGPKVPTASLGFPQMACRVWRCCLLFAAGGHGHQFGSCRPARGSAHVSHVSLDSGGPLGQGWG